jgi:hypothetical protein
MVVMLMDVFVNHGSYLFVFGRIHYFIFYRGQDHLINLGVVTPVRG